jgi:glutathionyl-hydroquinone reductase
VKDNDRASTVVGRIRALMQKAPTRTDSVDLNEAVREVLELTHGEALKHGVSVRTQLETLTELETLLDRQRFLCGPRIAESDWRLFVTLVRFDSVYVGHFKCNLRRLSEHPNLFAYTSDLYQWPDVRGTVDFAHIKRHYYESHTAINPTRVVPLGPLVDFVQPHGRDRRFMASA